MAKNIVIFSDGTGNIGAKNRGTNVYKLFEAIDVHQDNPKQIAFYDDGVGTSRLKPLKLLGGAIGIGLRRNVLELYQSIARVYEEGDQIYLFGFSRGGFTVRMLAGLIAKCGIIPGKELGAKLEGEARKSWRVYRAAYPSKCRQCLEIVKYSLVGKKPAAPSVGRQNSSSDARIYFIGVWDTVDAYGIPFKRLSTWICDWVYRYSFPDHDLSPAVSHARQALAVDDERRTFHPLLWNDDPRIRQVWFPGMHSDVGGGYPKHGLSLLSMHWMIQEVRRIAEVFEPENMTALTEAERVKKRGLILVEADREYFENRSNSDDSMHNSRSGPAVFYQYAPRDIATICAKHKLTEVLMHDSVLRRIWQQTQGYTPKNLPLEFKVETTGGSRESAPKVALDGRNNKSVYESAFGAMRTRWWLQRIQYGVYAALVGRVLSHEYGRGVSFLDGLANLGGTIIAPSKWFSVFGQACEKEPKLILVLLAASGLLFLASYLLRLKISNIAREVWQDDRKKL